MGELIILVLAGVILFLFYRLINGKQKINSVYRTDMQKKLDQCRSCEKCVLTKSIIPDCEHFYLTKGKCKEYKEGVPTISEEVKEIIKNKAISEFGNLNW